MRRRVPAWTLAGLLLWSGQSAAQEPLEGGSDQARAVMRAYAECLVAQAEASRPRALLVAFLNVVPQSTAGEEAARALAAPACLRGAGTPTRYVARLRFPPDLLRGELFRALYLDQRREPPRARIARAEIEPGFAQPAGALVTALQRFGDCVVRAEPVTADMAIRQAPGGAGEGRAIAALAPAMNACLTDGRAWRFSRAVLEGVLAEGLYRRATRP